MSSFSFRQVAVVYGKEIRDILRDRRTLMSMLLIPGVMIPVMIIGVAIVLAKTVHHAEAERASIMIVGADAPKLRERIEQDARLKLVPASTNFAQQIAEKRLRAAIEIPNGFDEPNFSSSGAPLKIYDYEGELNSGFATAELEHLISDYRESVVQARLTAHGLDRRFAQPFEIVRQNVAPPEKVGGNRFGGIIPYVLIMACFTGAMYPAIDLAAGEKERGTMETILCTPIGRLELALGKFFTVLTVSVMSVTAAMTGLIVSAVSLAFLIFPKMQGGGAASVLPTLNPFGILGVIVIMLPLATFFSAVIFAIALIAKTQKEAQTYISPLVGLLALPAFAPLLPGVELNAKFALVPILNVALVSKELVSGNFPWLMIAVIFISSLVYALIALGVAVRLFKRETIIFRT
ncbi:MAG TPA: ABC transporter permease subunit [Opitutaceae bacterium]